MLSSRIYHAVTPLLRRGRSCVDQIHNLRRIMEGFYQKQATLISIFVDFKKAIDSVDRQKCSRYFDTVVYHQQLTAPAW